MEICPLPGRFPAVSLQFGRIQRKFSIKRALKPPLCSCVGSTDLHNSADAVKLGCPNRMFILGMGFVGQFFAQDLKNQGWVVSGTCTTIAKKEKLEEMGFNVHVFHAHEPELEVLSILNHHTHLLVSIPPCVLTSDQMLQHAQLLKRVLDNKNLRWLCYLSSTSVYGDCGGAWVDENYQPSPSSELSKVRLAAEEGWLSLGHDLGLAAQIFRLGGIYGPGRSAIDTITKQEPLSEVQRVRSFRKYTSRVHVADICNALNASLQNPSPGRIYNIVDDDPAQRTEVFSFALNLIEAKWPSQFKRATSPDMSKSFIPEGSLMGEKRVSNARLKKELGVRLLHPNYRSGLQSIIDQMHNPHNPSGSCGTISS